SPVGAARSSDHRGARLGRVPLARQGRPLHGRAPARDRDRGGRLPGRRRMKAPSPAGRRRSLWGVFAAPIAIAVFTLVGLVAALTGDGLRDAVSWIALAVPLFVAAWALYARRS